MRIVGTTLAALAVREKPDSAVAPLVSEVRKSPDPKGRIGCTATNTAIRLLSLRFL
jgi:hypothetical protein